MYCFNYSTGVEHFTFCFPFITYTCDDDEMHEINKRICTIQLQLNMYMWKVWKKPKSFHQQRPKRWTKQIRITTTTTKNRKRKKNWEKKRKQWEFNTILLWFNQRTFLPKRTNEQIIFHLTCDQKRMNIQATRGKQKRNNDVHKIEINVAFKICVVNFIMFWTCKLCAYGNGIADIEWWSR